MTTRTRAKWARANRLLDALDWTMSHGDGWRHRGCRRCPYRFPDYAYTHHDAASIALDGIDASELP